MREGDFCQKWGVKEASVYICVGRLEDKEGSSIIFQVNPGCFSSGIQKHVEKPEREQDL